MSGGDRLTDGPASAIGVTGATGQLGGRVAERLHRAGVAQRLLVRNVARAPDLERATAVAADTTTMPCR